MNNFRFHQHQNKHFELCALQKSAIFHFHFEHFNLRSHSNCYPICYDWFKIIHAFVLLIELVSFIKSCTWCRAEKNEKKIMKIDMKRKRLSFEMDRRIWRITDKTKWQWFSRCCQCRRRRCRRCRWDTINCIKYNRDKKNPFSITVFCVHAYTWLILAYEFCGRWIRHCKFVCFSLRLCCECRFFFILPSAFAAVQL